jgi:hypothetical protein
MWSGGGCLPDVPGGENDAWIDSAVVPLVKQTAASSE